MSDFGGAELDIFGVEIGAAAARLGHALGGGAGALQHGVYVTDEVDDVATIDDGVLEVLEDIREFALLFKVRVSVLGVSCGGDGTGQQDGETES